MDFWPFHLANYALAVMMYATIGRFLLGLVVEENWSNFIWRGFKAVSGPAVAAVRAITPAAIPHPLVLVFAVIWLMTARVLLFLVFANFGLVPSVSGGPAS